MVVMASESDIGVLEQRIVPLDDSDNVTRVLRVYNLVVGIQVKRELDALQRKGWQVLLLLTLCFQLGILHIGCAEQEIEEFVCRGDFGRQARIQALNCREVRRISTAAAVSTTASTSTCLLKGESCSSSHFVGGDRCATAKLSSGILRIDRPRPPRTEPHHRLVLHLAALVVVMRRAQAQTVAHELHVIQCENTFSAD